MLILALRPSPTTWVFKPRNRPCSTVTPLTVNLYLTRVNLLALVSPLAMSGPLWQQGDVSTLPAQVGLADKSGKGIHLGDRDLAPVAKSLEINGHSVAQERATAPVGLRSANPFTLLRLTRPTSRATSTPDSKSRRYQPQFNVGAPPLYGPKETPLGNIQPRLKPCAATWWSSSFIRTW